jgi:hypothetical protein
MRSEVRYERIKTLCADDQGHASSLFQATILDLMVAFHPRHCTLNRFIYIRLDIKT